MALWKLILWISPIIGSCQMNIDAVTSSLGKDTLDYLELLTKDADGGPNPRVTCTEGGHYAATVVADEMEKLGLEKYGDVNRTTYFNVVPDSVHEKLCPYGIKNVIGLLRGTELPDEYIVVNGHIDGPNSENPEVQPVKGNGNTTDVYDNGISVAIGLAIAKKYADNPPKRSILFFFDDAEEGWAHLGTPEIGDWIYDKCFVKGENCSPEEEEFYNQVKQATCKESHCDVELFGADFQGYPIGAASWVSNPTVDLSKIKVAMFLESLGTPPGHNDTLVVIGGDQTSYGSNGTMNNFIQSIWPEQYKYTPMFNPAIPLPNYGSIDTFMHFHLEYCESNCSEAGGIPSLMFHTMAKQKYHGGTSNSINNEVPHLFSMLTEEYPSLKAELNGKYPSPAYHSEDNMAAMDCANLDGLILTIEELFLAFANSEDTYKLKYNEEFGADPVMLSQENTDAFDQTVYGALSATPESFQSVMTPIIEDIIARRNIVFEKEDEDIIESDFIPAYLLTELMRNMDFFNEHYEEKVAYSDSLQYFEPQVLDKADEDASSASSKCNVNFMSLGTVLSIATWFFMGR